MFIVAIFSTILHNFPEIKNFIFCNFIFLFGLGIVYLWSKPNDMITVITGVTYKVAHIFHHHIYNTPPLFNCPEMKKSTTEIVKWAEDVIKKNDDFRVVTMNCDVVSSIRYISEFYGKQSEFILVGSDCVGSNHGTNIDPLFKEFNKLYKLMNKFHKD